MNTSDRTYVRKLVWLAVGIIVVTMLFALFGCTTTKHTTTATTATDESYTRAVDSMSNVVTETVRFYESQIQQLVTGGVIFDTLFIPGDTIINTVTIHGSDITAKGKIKKVYFTDQSTRTERDLWKFRYDSLSQHRDTAAVRVVTETKYVDRAVKRKWFTGFVFWIIFALVGFVAGYYVKSKFKI